MSQIICRISGEILYKSDLLLGFDLQNVHPVFQAKKSIILTPQWIFRFTDARSLAEKKLYYLAVLNSMDLITWKHPAYPDLQTIEFGMMQAMSMACWIDYAKYGIRDRIQFPEYVVDRENYQLLELPVWLDRLGEIRAYYLARDREDNRKREINEQSQKIENEFRAAGFIGQAFTLPLARWALEVADCPEEKYRRWLDILQTPLNEAWTFSSDAEKNELKEIHEFLQDKLPVTNDQCLAVLVQMRKLREASKWGYSEDGEEDGEDGEEDGDNEGAKVPKTPRPKPPSYQILQEDVMNPENYEIPPEPQFKDYVKPSEYYGAKALWDLLVKELKGGRRGNWKQF